MAFVAIVTGGGSGVGQAVALALGRHFIDDSSSVHIFLIGRHEASLQKTIAAAGDEGMNDSGEFVAMPCDIGDANAVERVVADAAGRLGRIDVLVNAAGTNVPERSFEALSADHYREIMDANVNGAFFLVRAVLPTMRKQKAGTIVNIVSDAGLRANAKAGPAYVASKFALTGMTESINAEEGGAGVRACAIFPGDINTALLDRRPNPPPAEARAAMLRVDDIAQCVLLAVTLPPHAVVEKLVVRPLGG